MLNCQIFDHAFLINANFWGRNFLKNRNFSVVRKSKRLISHSEGTRLDAIQIKKNRNQIKTKYYEKSSQEVNSL